MIATWTATVRCEGSHLCERMTTAVVRYTDTPWGPRMVIVGFDHSPGHDCIGWRAGIHYDNVTRVFCPDHIPKHMPIYYREIAEG